MTLLVHYNKASFYLSVGPTAVLAEFPPAHDIVGSNEKRTPATCCHKANLYRPRSE